MRPSMNPASIVHRFKGDSDLLIENRPQQPALTRLRTRLNVSADALYEQNIGI